MFRGGAKCHTTNIKELNTLPKNIDILTYSFPCQDISQQGVRRGINEYTRSGLLYEVERILKLNRDNLPKVLLLENVKALTNKLFLKDFNKWLNALENLGYKSIWKVVNSTDYGSCQNRERVFCISYLDKQKNFTFPKPLITKKEIDSIIKNDDDMKECNHLLKYLNNDFKPTQNNITKTRLDKKYTNFNSEAYVYLAKGYGPTLTASGANSRLKFYFPKTNQLKYISPRQAFLYMGFGKNDYLSVAKQSLLNESKLLFLCGNSISIEVLEVLFKEVILCLI
ncbi:DNA (cytosine-5-)-methyltransferase [Mycoplasma mycoides]|uniref:DNA (cytosine-5-)-methyltransferase n=1 Tax=Mycoplasma mycoides TaxID=2102 RepID=UPI002ACEFDB5|nr:DNA (cytosine-5-)-methyltransferase [Mycoplasma mycoides]